MKEKLLLVFLVIGFIANSQQRNYTIKWKGSQVISADSYSYMIPSFDEDHFVYDFDSGLQFVDQWNISSPVNESSIVVDNVNYASISVSDLADLDVNTIPSELKFSLNNSKSRNRLYAFFQISPIVKDSDGVYKKIVSFKISYNTSPSSKSVFKRSNRSNVLSNSVLNTGEWFKFYVDKSGVFKLSKSFLRNLGVNVNDVDPKNIKLYGNGGRMIPYLNSDPYPFDVQENAIKFVGESDGVFNDGDYILFYAQGPNEFDSDSNTNINCYTDKTYYYINVGSSLGKRIQPFNQPEGDVDVEFASFSDYQFYEVDEHNIAFLGRRWFGDKFNIVNEKKYTFDFPDLIASEPVTLKTYFAAASSTATLFSVSVNESLVLRTGLGGSSGSSIARGGSFTGDVSSKLIENSTAISVEIEFNNQGNPTAEGYLDYISIEASRKLDFKGRQFQFKNYDSALSLSGGAFGFPSGIGQYTITNAEQISEIWDVTDIYNVSNFINSESLEDFRFKVNLGTLREYVALTESDYFLPNYDKNTIVSNQNLKGTVFLNDLGDFNDLDYIIVSPDNMISQANRLAQINKNKYNLNVKVFSLSEIYTEFSTGNQDIGAIRNFIKYVYDNASSPEERIKYVCLFGDCSLDYKGRISDNTNMVPSWYSYDSFNLTNSFVSDDFYGMMDANEGDMTTSDKLDIAVGRILADTPQRAKELVDKIESYHSRESLGSWRNKYVVISDDVDADYESVIQKTTNDIGDLVSQEKPFINVVKIHSDSYKQETSAGGESYPQVNTEISNAVDNGALVINYFGHGGEEVLASERILLKSEINDYSNFSRLNCFVTVTCEFTKFDNPLRETAGELVYWNKQGGAIALITTTRQIFVSVATRFNNTLGEYLFSYSDNDSYEDYEYPSIAEALMLTKNDPLMSGYDQRRLVFCIGDPALKLAIPEPEVRLTKINDKFLTEPTDTLKALSRIKFSGEVTDRGGNILDDYNGVLSTTIYDKSVNRTTLANDGTLSSGELIKLNFTAQGSIIFRGQASVTNGQFEFDFIVPKDIGIPVGYGKVSFYSKNEEKNEDQSGASINLVKIGGINENAEEDNIGPVINLYMNDEAFVSGGITNQSPTLLALMEDLNGINTSSGIGHDIVAILDGDETNPIVLNDFYQTEVDNYAKGVLSYSFRDLEPGLHTLTLRAWDVYNNSSTSEIQFIVYDEDEELVINNVLNYPNPFINYTEFWFNHNSSSPLDVSIQIFTVSGKLVRTLNGQTTGGFGATSSLSRDIVWDGRDDFGDKIGKGVYVYKLTVHSALSGKKAEKIEKLVIL